jgi:hypothetical protein
MTPHQPPYPFQDKTLACLEGRHGSCQRDLVDLSSPLRAGRRVRCACDCHRSGELVGAGTVSPTLPGFPIHREH